MIPNWFIDLITDFYVDFYFLSYFQYLKNNNKNRLVKQLPKDYKVVVLKNEFGDVKGLNLLIFDFFFKKKIGVMN